MRLLVAGSLLSALTCVAVLVYGASLGDVAASAGPAHVPATTPALAEPPASEPDVESAPAQAEAPAAAADATGNSI
jgi:hypothetical protein